MYPFLFFYANMIVTKNGVLNKVKLTLKLNLNLRGSHLTRKDTYFSYENCVHQCFKKGLFDKIPRGYRNPTSRYLLHEMSLVACSETCINLCCRLIAFPLHSLCRLGCAETLFVLLECFRSLTSILLVFLKMFGDLTES